jgi:molecular chaperone GrpE
LAQRAQADFLNYKRRIEQERSDYARSARADILLRVLPAIDDLDLAVSSLPRELADEDWAQGIVHIDRKLRSALDALGLKPIDPVGRPFDPWQQEGVGHEPSATVPAESVTRVVRAGYVLDGKVIRPAQVLISSGPPEPPG